jgi:hypothetical protein
MGPPAQIVLDELSEVELLDWSSGSTDGEISSVCAQAHPGLATP